MRKVIYIAGITGSGKTTIANKLGEFLGAPVLHTDDVYTRLAKQLGYKYADRLVWPAELDKFSAGRKLEYALYEDLVDAEALIYDTIILEGFSLCLPHNRTYLEKLLPDSVRAFFLIDPSFELWSQMIVNKGAVEKPTSNDFLTWKTAFYPHDYENWWRIDNPDVLFVPCEQYQRDGLTDKKVELLPLPSDMRGMKVLDLGCNDGMIGRALMDRGAKLYGADSNWRYLLKAREKGYERTELIDLNAMDDLDVKLLSCHCGFDRILSLAMLHYIKDKPAFIRRIASMLAPHGEAIIEMPTSDLPRRVLEVYNKNFVPSIPLLEEWLSAEFSEVQRTGESVYPDDGAFKRYIWRCKK